MATHFVKGYSHNNKRIGQYFGGHVVLVEINKAKFWKRKYHWLWIVQKLWVLDGEAQ